MDYTILKPREYKSINDSGFLVKDVQRTSSKKELYSIDVYYHKRPILVQTPTLTIHTDIIQMGPYYSLGLAMRNIEYERTVQEFYLFLSYIEYAILETLRNRYSYSPTYKPVYSIRREEGSMKGSDEDSCESEDLNKFMRNEFIEPDAPRNVYLRCDLKPEVTTVYTRFHKQIEDKDIYSDKTTPLYRNVRAQFILELPKVWFECNEKRQIQKLGFHWTALQIKIVDQCALPDCVIGSEAPAFDPTYNPFAPRPLGMASAFPMGIPPPPPPPLPGMGRPMFGSGIPTFPSGIPPIPPSGTSMKPKAPTMMSPLKMISSSDILAGIGQLRKVSDEPPRADKPLPQKQGGFQPPTLADILSMRGRLKKTSPKGSRSSSCSSYNGDSDTDSD